MQDVTTKNFGLLIAYLIPGFTTLWGVSYFSPTVRGWLELPSYDLPTIGGFLYATIASSFAGMVVSTIRWMTIDQLHAATGLRRPRFNYGRLHQRISGYEALVGNMYRYYQHYSNMMIAVPLACVAHVAAHGWHSILSLILFVAFEILYGFASRDTLRNYFAQQEMLLGHTRSVN